MHNGHIGKTCPFCQFPLKADSEVVVCAECCIPHHRECWAENGGCATFGHQGLRAETSLVSDVNWGEISFKEDIEDFTRDRDYAKNDTIIMLVVAYLLILLGILFLLNTFSNEIAFRKLWTTLPLILAFEWLFFQSKTQYLSTSSITFIRKVQYVISYFLGIAMIILLTMLTSFIFLGMYLGLWQVSIQELIIFMSPVIIVVVGLTLIRRKANR